MNLPEIIQNYEQDGFVRLRGLFEQQQVQQIRDELQRYIQKVVPTVPPADRTFEADGKTVRNLWRIDQHDAFFRSLADSHDLRRLIGGLVHGEPVLMAIETFNKPAKIGSAVPSHQDNAYFCQSPNDVLTVWIALDAATLENGPIYYLKGSHKLGTLPHKPSGVAGNSMGIVNPPAPDPANEFCGTLEPGDALIHNCLTIHWSAPNKSDRSRCGLLMVFRGSHTKQDPKLKENYEQARRQ
jgi:phytanoyl-CoA hydroxylase